jgi:hypothetical protein
VSLSERWCDGVKEQLGHGSIQLTVDTYGHLIPGANRGAVDCLDDEPVHQLHPRRIRRSAARRVFREWWFKLDGEPTRNRTPLLPVAPVMAKHRERAGRVTGAQRRSGPLTRLSAPGQSGTGATANQEAITPGKLGATLAGTGAEAKQFRLFLPEGKFALTSVQILGQHSHAHDTRAPAHLRH